MPTILQPLIEHGPIIFWHAMLALSAIILALWQLWASKGTTLHRLIGRVWIAVMGIVALSSFWIHTLHWIGPFSPIHLLSVYTLYNLPRAVLAARLGDIDRHRAIMRSLVIAGLLLPGAFTLLPYRAMHAVVFGG